MCGLSAIVELANQGQNGHVLEGESQDSLTRELEESLQLIKHRGPDSSGVWVSPDQRIGLGHNRLAINDLSPSGSQPLHSADNAVHAIVIGELYDFEKLKADLVQTTGYNFSSNCDSEIVLALYEEYGPSFLHYLKGEFALCLYDSRKKLFIAARDRYGVKPLFWTVWKQRLLLASEIKSFLPLGWEPEWDVRSLVEGGWNFDDRTIFKDVRKVRPGFYMTCDASGHIQHHQYWDMKYPDKNVRDLRNESDIIQGVRDRLTEAVRVRLRADVPIGVYLSGGIDSSVIAGLATHLSKELGTNLGSIPSKDRVSCFCIAFDKTSGFDESDIAERTAEFLGVKLHKQHVGEEEIASLFEDATWHCEHHNLDLNHIGKFALSEFPRELGFKVVLTGEGADETFAGYHQFLSDVLREADLTWDSGLSKSKRLHLLDIAEADTARWCRSLGVDFEGQDMSEGRRNLNGIKTLDLMSVWAPSVFPDWTTNLQPLKAQDVIANHVSPLVVGEMKQKWHPIHTAQYVWTKGHLASLLLSCLGDRMEMAHSIEGRTPFLDHNLTEYVNNIPPSLKVKWNESGSSSGKYGLGGWNESGSFTGKYALREAMKSFVTQEVYERAKHPYTAPVIYPVDGPLHRLLSKLITKENVEQLGFVAWDKAETLLDRGFREKEDLAFRLAIMVAQWVVLAQKFGIKTASQA